MWRTSGCSAIATGSSAALSVLEPAWRALDGAAHGERSPLDADGWRTASILTVGRLIARAALRREESRGGHYRSDFPERDDIHWKRQGFRDARSFELKVATDSEWHRQIEGGKSRRAREPRWSPRSRRSRRTSRAGISTSSGAPSWPTTRRSRAAWSIRPYGYAIWELIQQALDARFKATGHVNAYFPLFIPESLLMKEAEHVEGFAPQVAWVTQGGDEELEERLVVRPTSEVIIGTMYAKWIKSWRDLPVLINQWANVVRWEKVTRPFLRTTEFLWQEGHTAHETEPKAQDETLKILALYKEFAENELAMPVVDGQKSESEKFAGASRTYSIEALMGDGRALQAGTSHNLGQNFAKAFEIQFQGRDKTRAACLDDVVGRVDAADRRRDHDARRRQRPDPAAARRALSGRDRADPARQLAGDRAAEGARDCRASCGAAGVRVMLDDRDAYTPGWKFAEWELRGVPLRLEIGPKDIEKSQVLLARRDTREKAPMPMDGLAERVVGAARRRSSRRCSQRARHVPRGAHARASTLRRVQGGDGRPARIRHRRLVRQRGVRGADQGRDAGDDAQHPVRQRGRCRRPA